MQQLGIKRKRTTSYHPACNGAIARFHRTLKAALRAKCTELSFEWLQAMPLVLLGLRSTLTEEGFSPAQLVYGANLDLPAHYFSANTPEIDTPNKNFISRFFQLVRDFPTPLREHVAKSFIPKDLSTDKHVWLKESAPKTSLSNRYNGPHEILDRDEKTITILFNGRREKVSVDCVKLAFLQSDIDKSTPHQEATTTESTVPKPNTVPGNTKPDNHSVDKVVYAKSSFSRWPIGPARIIDPANTPLARHRQPQNSVAIQYFGTNNYVYADMSKIWKYSTKHPNHRALQKAIRLADAYLATITVSAIKIQKKVRFATRPTMQHFAMHERPSEIETITMFPKQRNVKQNTHSIRHSSSKNHQQLLAGSPNRSW